MSLSDKIFPNGSHLHVKDVKEFIKKIIDGFMSRFYADVYMPTEDYDEFLEFIKKEAGGKLIENE